MSKKQEHRRQKKAAKRRASSKARKGGGGLLYKSHQRRVGEDYRKRSNVNGAAIDVLMERMKKDIFGE